MPVVQTAGPQPVYASNLASYAFREPYITLAEYKNAPTAVDLSNLILGGTQAQQDQALADTINRASSWVDELVYESADGTLAATSNVQQGRYRVNRHGTVRIPVRFKPLLAVTAVSVGPDQGSLTALTDLSHVTVDRTTVEVPVLGVSILTGPVPYYGTGGVRIGQRPVVQLTYANGWPVATITAPSAAGAATLTVSTIAGMFPGTPLTVYDGANTEQIVVQSASGNTLTPVSPLLNAHAAGVGVSNLPPRVKQATISLTSALIRQRGTDSIEMASITSEPSKELPTEPGGMDDVAIAVDLLASLKRAV